MMLRWTVAAALGAMTLPAVAGAGQPVKTITVRQDFTYAVCTGVCLDHELTVRSDGTAVRRIRGASGGVGKGHRYRVSASEFAAFRDALANVRPHGRRGPIGDCGDRPDALRIAGKPDMTIRWQDGGHADQLTACDVAAVRQASAAGYRALRINIVTGARLSTAGAVNFYASWGAGK